MNELLINMQPELMTGAILFILLALKLGKGLSNSVLLSVIQVLLLVNFATGFFAHGDGKLFDDMYQTNSLIVLQKNILNGGVLLIALVFTEWFRKCEHLSEFFILLLSSLLGMFFMLSSGNLLMFYLSLELATIPVAALSNFHLDKKASSEAAMKMILSSAFSSGILLFGISLIYGTTGSLSFTELPTLLNGSPLQLMAFVFFFTAFAFKMSVVPFHLWTADVYEGSPIPVTSYLSVISKGAVSFIFLSMLYKVFASFEHVWYIMVMILSILTMVSGNLFALRQQNIKRFLAFSSIAQVGFILVGLSSHTVEGSTSVIYFILIYIFSNLAAFGVAGLISFFTGRESIHDYKGLYSTNPFLSWVLALALFSLAGIPPTAGFFGKLFLLSSGASKGTYLFIGLAAVNMIVSLYYYLRVVRAVFMDHQENPVPALTINPLTRFALILCGAGIVLTGMISWIYETILQIVTLHF